MKDNNNPQKSEWPGGAGQIANQTEAHPNSIKTACFLGTVNKRHLRAIQALLRRPMPRENLDTEAGCSNGPELVAELRRRGLEVPCHRINFVDRDGFICRPGLLPVSPPTIWRWVKAGKFPAPYKLGAQTTVWDKSAVDAWLEQQRNASTPTV